MKAWVGLAPSWLQFHWSLQSKGGSTRQRFLGLEAEQPDAWAQMSTTSCSCSDPHCHAALGLGGQWSFGFVACSLVLLSCCLKTPPDEPGRAGHWSSSWLQKPLLGQSFSC